MTYLHVTPLPQAPKPQTNTILPAGVIELRDVDFAYPSRPNVQVCQGYNLVIRPGETVALCGASGAGKVNTSNSSTLDTALLIPFVFFPDCFLLSRQLFFTYLFCALLLPNHFLSSFSPSLPLSHTVDNYELAPALLRPPQGVSPAR